MEYLFNIKGETPAKKNSRVTNTHTGRTFPNKRYTVWHDDAKRQLEIQKKAAGITEPLNSVPLEILCLFTHGDKRKRDADNGLSSIMDLLKDLGIISDDNYFIVPKEESLNHYEKNNANCYIWIRTDYKTQEIEELYNRFNNDFKTMEE